VSLRRIALGLCLGLALAAPVEAQNPHAYAVGEVGGSFGDGKLGPAVALGVGYMTPKNIGFEIEVAYVPDLDFDDPGFPRIAIFPPIEIESTGRLISLQTNVIAVLPGGGQKLRAFVLGGGGVADVKQEISIRSPLAFTPVFPGVPGLPPLPPLSLTVSDEISDTNFVLTAGAGFDYEVTSRFGIGTTIRYQHVFGVAPQSLDMARAGIRARWRF
jgi:hypothetical protein